MGEKIIIELFVEFYENFPSVEISLEIKRINMGINIVHINNQDCGLYLNNVNPGKHGFLIELPNILLYPHSYSLTSIIMLQNYSTILDCVEDIINFDIIQSSVTKRNYSLSSHKQAIFYMPSKWHMLF
jgi:hypothetical protein